jgi:uncharacterized protein (DUF58 family)
LSSLRYAAARILRAWAARRFGLDSLPHTINRRRIYILPSGYGLAFSAMIGAMMLAGLNYGSNLGLAFAFLMASIALIGMHHCHRNLLGLEVDATREADGFAGERATLQFVLRNASGIDRWDVEIRCPDFAAPGAADAATTSSATASVTAMSQQQLSVALATPRRGILQLSQFELRTRYPFGWFRAWSYVHAPLTVYVAPQPQGERPLTSGGGAAGTAANTDLPGDEDFAGLRAYAPGIPLKHMAWKVLARGSEAAVRSYSSLAAQPDWLDWHALADLGPEARLSQLCRWVLDADAAGRGYGLRLPGLQIEVGRGAAHRTQCMRALAQFTLEAPP